MPRRPTLSTNSKKAGSSGNASCEMSPEAPAQTLQATALVHEAYVRLVGDDPDLPRPHGGGIIKPWSRPGEWAGGRVNEQGIRGLASGARGQSGGARLGGREAIGAGR